jgi:hypothetical protein
MDEVKTFTLRAKAKLLPPDITPSGLIWYSSLKKKKKWFRNRRLRKKFLKNFKRYLPSWAIFEWEMQPVYKDGARQIMEAEDQRILQEMMELV